MRVFEYNDLYTWLSENEDVTIQEKIDKAREIFNTKHVLNSYTFFLDEFENSKGEYYEVQLNVDINDYESERDREGIFYGIEVNGAYQEVFTDHKEAYEYYIKTIDELR